MLELQIYIDSEGKPKTQEMDKPYLHDFYNENKNRWVIMRLISPDENRTYEMNKRYWALLNLFVPDHFNSTDDAHDYFTEKYLKKNDIFDIKDESFNEILIKIKKYARRIISIKTNGNIEVIWVRSTSTLSKQEFKQLMDHVEREGSELGIEFKI